MWIWKLFPRIRLWYWVYKVYPDGRKEHVRFERYNLSAFIDSNGIANPRRRTEKISERVTVISERTNWWRHRAGWDFMLRLVEPSWRAVLFVFLADFVLLMTLSISGQAERYAEIAEKSETIEDWHYLGDIANQWQAVFALVFGVVMAVFTYMLYRISVAQMAMLDRANKTSDDALEASREATKQTKRSVDAFIEAERGRLFLDRTGLGPDSSICHFAFKNIGNGPLVITAFEFTKSLFEKSQEPPYPMGPQRDRRLNRPLMKGEFFSSQDWGEGVTRTNMARFANGITPEETRKLNSGTHRLFIQFDFRYTTLGTQYQMRETLVFTRRGANIYTVVIGGSGAQYDRRRNDQSIPERLPDLLERFIESDKEHEQPDGH